MERPSSRTHSNSSPDRAPSFLAPLNTMQTPYLRFGPWTHFASLVILSVQALGQTGAPPPTLLADLEQAPSQAIFDSNPEGVAISGNTWLFSTQAPSPVPELWLSDGTPAGTRSLSDLSPGVVAPPPQTSAVLPGGRILIAALGDGVGTELHIVDPVGDTVSLVLDIRPGEGSANPEELTLWNGEAWFTADDGVHGRQLWRSDGTAAGTTQATSLFGSAGIGDDSIVHGTTGALFLVSVTGGRTLWSFATPSAGPQILLQSSSSAPFLDQSTDFGFFTSVDSTAVFSFLDLNTGLEPWISDGTVLGTQILADMNPGPLSSSPLELATGGGRAWFRAQVQGSGFEPYATDGTLAGTVGPLETQPGPAPSSLSLLAEPTDATATPLGLFFVVDEPAAGSEPWFSDGTVAGTQRLGDLEPGPGSSSPRDFFESGGQVFFIAEQFGASRVFRTDGTPAGTGFFQDAGAGDASLEAASAQTLFLTAESPAVGVEPFALDLAGASVQMLANVAFEPETLGSSPITWMRVRDRTFFLARTEATGLELWKTDGSSAGTSLVDAVPGPGGITSAISLLTAVGERLLFTAQSTSPGLFLFSSDGTPPGTIPLAGPSSFGAAELGDRAIVIDFGADQLLSTDGTVAGTQVLLSPPSAPFDNLILGPIVFGDRAWFQATDPVRGNEWWSTDGTPAGTQFELEFEPGPNSSAVTGPFIVGRDRALVFGNTTALGTEPYLLTEQGDFFLLGDLSPGSASTPQGALQDIQPFGGDFLFTRLEGPSLLPPFISPINLYRTDGPGNPLVQLDAFLNPSINPISPTVVGDHVFFWAANPDQPFAADLWFSDGTPGSETLAGTLPGAFGFPPVGFGSLIFFGSMASAGSDDTVLLFPRLPDDGSFDIYRARAEADSLELYADYGPGPSSPFEVEATTSFGAQMGGTLLLQATDPLAGREPHAASLADVGSYIAEPYGFGCGASIGAEGEARIGLTIDITLEADPLAISGLFFSFEQGFALLGSGCRAEIGPVVSGFLATTDANGEAAVALSIPNLPSLAGLETYWQWASLSPGGPFNGAANLSGGLELVIGY